MSQRRARDDKRMPPMEECVLPAVLDRQAARIGDEILWLFEDGPSWTYAETREIARGTAAALHELGVRRGDNVLVWLPNGPEIVRVIFGLTYLGAVYVPLNTAVRGRALEHIVSNTGAELMIGHAELVSRLEDIDRADLGRVVVMGGEAPAFAGVEWLAADAVAPVDREPPALAPPLEAWDIHAILFTSGTTGPSKGVLVPNLLVSEQAHRCMHFMTADDRFMINTPFFHSAAIVVPHQAIRIGASMALIRQFRTSTFWNLIRETESTLAWSLGTMASFLLKAPPRADDRDTPLRAMNQVPVVHDAAVFSERFGVLIYTQFDMTEIPAMARGGPVTKKEAMQQGFCGKLLPGAEVRLVDAFDREVPDGRVGELICRADAPWSITPGYYRMPEATAQAWRNGWFHTGDLFMRNADGNYYFVDRAKDAIRRRGENISSQEVEAEVLEHPAVESAAAIGVPSEHGEDEVLVALEPKRGRTVDPVDLVDFLIPRMAHYMVPRYVRVMPRLPRTETEKIQKSALRAEGVTADTWDREAAGIVIKSDRIGRRP